MANGAAKYFPQLTGVRAMAAYMVFFFHYNPFQTGFFFDFFNELHTGVTLFFVLSGFLIAHRYMDHVELSKGWFSQYMMNRVARIYPMYFLLTICAFIFVHDIPRTVPIFILNITFLRGFSDLYKLTGIPQGWSLTVEECFYVLAPFIFILSKRVKLFLQPLLFIAMGILLVAFFRNHYVYGLFNSYTFLFVFTFFGRCLEFYIGIWLALLVKRKKIDRHGIAYTITGMAGMVLCIVMLLLVKKESGYKYSLNDPLGIFVNNFILPFFIGMLYFGLLTEKSFFCRLLGTPLLQLLGKSSYIFYLIHVGFISNFFKAIFPLGNKLNYLIFFVLLNLTSILLFKFAETPLNKFIRTLGRKKSAELAYTPR